MIEATVQRTRGRPRGRTVGDALTVRLPDELRAELDQYVEQEDRPVAGVVRQALRQFFDANRTASAISTHSPEEELTEAS